MTLSARYDHKKLGIMLVLSLLLLAASYELALNPAPLIYSVAQVAVIIFAFLTGLVVVRFFDPNEVLRVDENGVYDRRLVDRTIPWNVISDIKEIRFFGLRFFAVVTRVPAETFMTSRLKRRMAWMNEKTGFHPLGINTIGLTVSARDLDQALASYAPKDPDDDPTAEP